EGGAIAQIVDGVVHRLADSQRQRLGDVADATTNDVRGSIRLRLSKRLDTAVDLRKEVTGSEFQIMLVDKCHGSIGMRVNAAGQDRQLVNSIRPRGEPGANVYRSNLPAIDQRSTPPPSVSDRPGKSVSSFSCWMMISGRMRISSDDSSLEVMRLVKKRLM